MVPAFLGGMCYECVKGNVESSLTDMNRRGFLFGTAWQCEVLSRATMLCYMLQWAHGTHSKRLFNCD
jgi:hypothetical protein